MPAYYNENNAYAAEWLRNLIAAGHIAAGDVDERSIENVSPDDLAGYGQCHFFAGIGGWSLALRLAGWPDERPVWTGSCPCQPFSVAGKQRAENDERHLWPEWARLIRECRPPVVFGEQVASRPALAWLDGVCDEMEAAGYACAAANLPAAGVAAPHIRQRLYWMGIAHGNGCEPWARDDAPTRYRHTAAATSGSGDMADASSGRQQPELAGNRWQSAPQQTGMGSGVGGVADTGSPRHEGRTYGGAYQGGATVHGHAGRDSATGDGWNPLCPWRDASHVFCRDGRWRPFEPGAFPLVHGVSSGMGQLRAYGNAIVPQVAAAFVRAAYM